MGINREEPRSLGNNVYENIIAELWGRDEANKFISQQGRSERAMRDIESEKPKGPGILRTAGRTAFGNVVRNGGSYMSQKQNQQAEEQMEVD